MEQINVAEAEYGHKKRKTFREEFLERIDALIPWERLVEKPNRHCSKEENVRQSYPLEGMPQIHSIKKFYPFNVPARKDALL